MDATRDELVVFVLVVQDSKGVKVGIKRMPACFLDNLDVRNSPLLSKDVSISVSSVISESSLPSITNLLRKDTT